KGCADAAPATKPEANIAVIKRLMAFSLLISSPVDRRSIPGTLALDRGSWKCRRMPNLAFAGSLAFTDDDTIEDPRIVSRDMRSSVGGSERDRHRRSGCGRPHAEPARTLEDVAARRSVDGDPADPDPTADALSHRHEFLLYAAGRLVRPVHPALLSPALHQ